VQSTDELYLFLKEHFMQEFYSKFQDLHLTWDNLLLCDNESDLRCFLLLICAVFVFCECQRNFG